jgi:hypothetical protein
MRCAAWASDETEKENVKKKKKPNVKRRTADVSLLALFI